MIFNDKVAHQFDKWFMDQYGLSFDEKTGQYVDEAGEPQFKNISNFFEYNPDEVSKYRESYKSGMAKKGLNFDDYPIAKTSLEFGRPDLDNPPDYEPIVDKRIKALEAPQKDQKENGAMKLLDLGDQATRPWFTQILEWSRKKITFDDNIDCVFLTVNISTSETVIEHTLGRVPKGIIPIAQYPNNISELSWSREPTNQKLHLKQRVSGTMTLMIF
jgi:hypothetical protein